jgi:hypothetical protein
MSTYSYAIGDTLIGLELLVDDLGMQADPRHTFREFATSVRTIDGLEKGLGRPSATWTWDIISLADRSILRTYVTAKSARVFITTRVADDDYVDFEATMIWPDEEEKDAGRRLDFVIEFINMVEQ